MGIIIIAVLVIIFLILWATIDIVPQAEARVIERLGVFHAVWGAGIHLKIPVIDRAVIPHIDLREQVMELPKSPKTVHHGYWGDDSYDANEKGIFYNSHVETYTDANADGEGSADPMGITRANINAALGIGVGASANRGSYRQRRFERDHSLFKTTRGKYTYSSDDNLRDVITKDNVKMQVDAAVFYQITDPKQYAYGMKQPLLALQKLTLTTLRNIFGELELDETLCSRELINSKLRAVLDEATDSWGIKITRVEIENIVPPHDIQEAMEAQVKAERNRRAMILTAEGVKKATILEAEGEAERNRMLNDNAPVEAVIKTLAIDAMRDVANGKSTKIIIPSEMQGLVGLANGLTEGVTPNSAPVVKQ